MSNPMQRFFRDGHMASNPLALDTDIASLNLGQMAMGGENTGFNISP